MSERELDRTIGEGRALRVGAGPTNGRNRRAPLVAGRPREGPFTIRFADLSSSFILVRSRTTNRHPLSCPVLLITLKCAPHRTEQRDPDAKFPLIECDRYQSLKRSALSCVYFTVCWIDLCPSQSCNDLVSSPRFA